jgi:hypothetical protein
MKKVAKRQESNLVAIEVSAAEEIASIQLERLKQISRDRMLSYEELKMYDILNKNLSLIKGEATSINTTSHVIKETKAEEITELLEIASTVSEKDIKKVLNFVEADTDVATETPDK